jgi:hypothetical protein
LGVAVRRPAKQAEPFGFALIFWLHLLHQGKRWNNNNQYECYKEEQLLQHCFAKLRVNWLSTAKQKEIS